MSFTVRSAGRLSQRFVALGRKASESLRKKLEARLQTTQKCIYDIGKRMLGLKLACLWLLLMRSPLLVVAHILEGP